MRVTRGESLGPSVYWFKMPKPLLLVEQKERTCGYGRVNNATNNGKQWGKPPQELHRAGIQEDPIPRGRAPAGLIPSARGA